MIRSRLAAAAAGLLAAGTVMLVAGPAMAVTPPALPVCAQAATPPFYTAKCIPTVTGTPPGAITVMLPGVGTLNFTVKADGTIDTTGTPPTVTGVGTNFTASTPKVSDDGTHITVSFFNAATPTQHYTIKAKVVPPTTANGTPTVSAVAGPNRHHKGHEHKDDESSSGAEHENSDGAHGNVQGSMGDGNSQGKGDD